MRVVWDSHIQHTHKQESAREFMNSNQEILESEANAPRWEGRVTRHSDRQRSFQYNKYYFVAFLVPSIMFSRNFNKLLAHKPQPPQIDSVSRAESICSKCLCYSIYMYCYWIENEREWAKFPSYFSTFGNISGNIPLFSSFVHMNIAYTQTQYLICLIFKAALYFLLLNVDGENRSEAGSIGCFKRCVFGLKRILL